MRRGLPCNGGGKIFEITAYAGDRGVFRSPFNFNREVAQVKKTYEMPTFWHMTVEETALCASLSDVEAGEIFGDDGEGL